MAYTSLDSFSKNWIFKREDPKVTTQDLAEIRLLDEQGAASVWRDYISDNQIHPDHFTEQDWPNKAELQVMKVAWEKRWDSTEEALPEEVLTHVTTWGEETKVFFCCHNELVFEMPWGVFKRTWKAFLFLDNGPILVGRKKSQAVQFHSDGMATMLFRR
ncbi:hypothetical protein MSP8887_02175 [Marinomonas spartinae]|uniref:DUF2947 family protein n=1 Tax=Marinomonas spartinae TaxID=1792290 RepID=UPI000808DC2B|nr:DUF2947 family protein [Marinomonas spartinae]SBS34547.1 hypothetical protein MSP8887_02175 [Marinomonas spartinae]